MKIAYIYDVVYPETIGGVEKRIHEIGVRLARQDHEVHLYGMKYWDGPDTIYRDGLIIHGVCPAMGLYTEGRRSIIQALTYTICLIPWLMLSKAEIIDCQNFPYFPVLATHLSSVLGRQACVVTWHEFWGRYWFDYLGWGGLPGLLIERLALWCSKHAIAVSPLTAGQMITAGIRIPPDIIPNGIDQSTIAGVSPAPESSDIIFAGRFIPEKHPEMVVDAVSILIHEFPDIRCFMIGDGPEFITIQTLIRERGLERNIRCPGFVADHAAVISLMKSSRVFVLPSEREGFGIAAIEAMACGLSLVTINHPRNAASAHVLPGCGYLATPDAADIAEGIRTCLSAEPDKEALNLYVKAHDWDTIALQLEAYYRSLLLPSPSSASI
ncbi:MAG TPA: glycosyltransferase [Methanospirillum sp.]|nr:glycosyltransferase [Methanospirillum sp.]